MCPSTAGWNECSESEPHRRKTCFQNLFKYGFYFTRPCGKEPVKTIMGTNRTFFWNSGWCLCLWCLKWTNEIWKKIDFFLAMFSSDNDIVFSFSASTCNFFSISVSQYCHKTSSLASATRLLLSKDAFSGCSLTTFLNYTCCLFNLAYFHKKIDLFVCQHVLCVGLVLIKRSLNDYWGPAETLGLSWALGKVKVWNLSVHVPQTPAACPDCGWRNQGQQSR